ncbi:hypothetical protein M422DRAFT_775971 [Sphaerobolus stellatus SS14]|uniref:Uncharacterized protein n=1 Tax=Sphaerobolus stellatus (strain SS14) TaxID=990650 RepID=A0A0C9V7R6_SPHS4|nr:hypothetical protein M422DRAFT_779840 [Sphaerobolus stellatus SS14]KIJ52759.1 hypothetical protein M422DRAFT_775971 [Sphaerobolus stellatus SS14]
MTTLPGDIWAYVAEYLVPHKTDLLSLSRTDRYIRDYVYPYLFRRIKFSGCRESTEAFREHLAYISTRIEYFRRRHFVNYVWEIELWNWVKLPTDICSSPRDSARETLSLWRSTFDNLQKFIIECRNLKGLGLIECSRTIYSHQMTSPGKGVLDVPLASPPSSPCFGIEFVITRPDDITSFSVPQAFMERQRSDSWRRVVRLYFLDILATFSARVVGAAVDIDLVASLQPFSFSHLRTFSVICSQSQASGESFDRLRDLLIVNPLINELSMPDSPSDLALSDLPPDALPDLECITSGNMQHLMQIIPGRPLKSVRVQSSHWRNIEAALPQFQLSAVHIENLDISGCPLSAEGLETLAANVPHLKSLVVPWIPDITILDSETMISNCLTMLAPFKSLKTFSVISIPVPASQLDIPAQFASIRRSRGHPSLQTVKLGSDIKFTWYKTSKARKMDLRRGWIYDGSSMNHLLYDEAAFGFGMSKQWAVVRIPVANAGQLETPDNIAIHYGRNASTSRLSELPNLKSKKPGQWKFWKKYFD